MSDLYREDLAYVHDQGFRAVPEAAARWLCEYLDSHAVPEGQIVDLGCGSGVFAAGLASTGRSVLGLDISPEMLRLARRAAPAATFRQGSLFDAALPDAAVISLVGEGLNYVPPSGRMPSLGRMFRRLRRALPERGLLFFDVITGPRARLVPRHFVRRGADWAILSDNQPARAPERFTRDISVFRRRGRHYRRSDERHTVHIWDRGEIAEVLRHSGFRFTTRRAYAPEAQHPGRTVFVARAR